MSYAVMVDGNDGWWMVDGGWWCKGKCGTDPGQFNIPHNIAMHPDNDKVIVIDRENSRAQLFKLDGTFVELWPIHRVRIRNSPDKLPSFTITSAAE